MAITAHAQSAVDLRPALDGEEEQEIVPAPLPVPKVTRLEANAPLEEATPRRRRPAEVDPYAPTGIALGAFRLFPVLDTGAALSSNPARRETGAHADTGAFLRPSLQLQSDWTRHQLAVNASGNLIYFLSESSADAQNFDVGAKLRLDILRGTTLDLDTAWAADIASDPGDAGSAGFDHDISASAALAHRMGRLELRGKSGASLNLFGETAGTSNADLDYVEPELSLRASYDLTPVLKPFVEAGYRPRLFLQSRDRNGVARSSRGAFASAGWSVDLAPFWSAAASATWQLRDYQDPSLGTSGSFSANANVSWKPTDLTTVDLAASTFLADGSSASVEGSRTTTIDLDISHDLREHVTLKASAGFEAEKVAGGTDTTFTAGADVIYRFSPWLALTAAYDALAFDSSTPGGDYTEHRVTAGVEIRR